MTAKLFCFKEQLGLHGEQLSKKIKYSQIYGGAGTQDHSAQGLFQMLMVLLGIPARNQNNLISC